MTSDPSASSPAPSAEPTPTADAWIASFAAALGVDAPDPATVELLLALAGVAAHASERVAAPIACYLVGRAGAEAAAALDLAASVAPPP